MDDNYMTATATTSGNAGSSGWHFMPRGIPRRRSCKKQRAGGTLAATFSSLSATKGSFVCTPPCRLRNVARKIGKNEALFEFSLFARLCASMLVAVFRRPFRHRRSSRRSIVRRLSSRRSFVPFCGFLRRLMSVSWGGCTLLESVTSPWRQSLHASV